MDSYEINKDTYAIMSVNNDVSKVLEKDDEYFINKNSLKGNKNPHLPQIEAFKLIYMIFWLKNG